MPDPQLLAQTQLLPNLRAYLTVAGIGRAPGTVDARDGVYPLWLDPRGGVPAPGEKAGAEDDPNVVLGAFQVSGIARAAYDASYLRTDAVDIWVRARLAPFAYDVDDRLRDVLSDKRAYSLGVLTILESHLFRPLQLLSSDANGYTFTTQYTFERPRP